ncbi:MAG: hypothetical protein Tsb0013_11250 [Phycisphaerales bacterium]
MDTTDKAKEFYDAQYQGETYAANSQAQQHNAQAGLQKFIDTYELRTRKCLEIGCGRGAFQDLVDDYTGVDYADSVRPYLRKPFVQASAAELPFEDNTFDAAWTIWVFEHIPEMERALEETRRVLKPGGLLYFNPAWQCRSWAAKGYPVRPYSDFGLGGKLIKASIPLRNSVAWRAMGMFPRRVMRAMAARSGRPLPLKIRTLEANFEHFWMSDSDAVNSIDPYETMLWFVTRGDEILSHPTPRSRFLVRGGAQVVRINK